MPWAAFLFVPLYYISFDIGALCATAPPTLPPIDVSTLNASLDTITNTFKAIAWFSYCHCKPGTPSPTPFPPPSQTQPPGWPSAPTFPCDPADLCAALVAIRQQLAALAQTVSSNYELMTIVQRYAEPFEYIRGAAHTNISGVGSVTVPRLLGIQADLVAVPDGMLVLPGNPNYRWDLGWLSITGVDGVLEERRLIRAAQTWLPVRMAMAHTFGWYLNPGVVFNFTELEAEP
jgi:hypothetical protein